MTVYYDYASDGKIAPVKGKRRDSVGLKYLTSSKVRELSDGNYSEEGWLVSDHVCAPISYAGSDDLGTKGVFCPADGKTYDSRSAYYRAVKNKGLVILGDDAKVEQPKRETKTVNWEKAVAETLKRTPLNKGKKK